MRQKDKRRKARELTERKARGLDVRPALAFHAGPRHLVHCPACAERVESPHGVLPIRDAVGWETSAADLAVRCHVCRRVVFHAAPYDPTL